MVIDKKILIFKIGAIGDTIMTTPFLRQLRQNYPNAKIDYLIGNTASQVLENNPNIDEIIRFDEKIFFKKKIIAWKKLITTIKNKKYDTIFVLDKHWIFHLTAKLFKIKERIGFDRLGKEGRFLTKKVHFDGKKHEIHSYLDLLKEEGDKIDYKDNMPTINLTKNDEKFQQNIWKKHDINKKVITIAPGGANNPGQSINLKIWPKENYLELIKKINKKYQIILVGDKNDEKTGEYLSKNSNAINLIGKTNLKQTATIMKASNYIICNDTGPMHLASCVNNNVISLFGPTNPKRFAPLNKNSTHIWKKENCAPCNNIYGSFKKCKHQNCMKKIMIDEILKLIK